MPVTWTPPGAGQWALDRSHFPGGTTPWAIDAMEAAMAAGTRRAFAELGVPADTVEARFVHGFLYTRLRPLVGADRPPKRLPPALVLKLAVRLHPEMRRRERAAARAAEQRPWLARARDWYRTGKPVLQSRNDELAAVDVAALDDAALLAHLAAIHRHVMTSAELHFYLHGFDLGPLARYVFDASRWKLPVADLLPLLQGASPSTSEPARILARLRSAVEESGTAPGRLDDIRAISAQAAADLDTYLSLRSTLLVTRYDLTGLTLGELPHVVLATILAAPGDRGDDGLDAATAAVRDRVPEADRAEFDEILADARYVMDMRDDNGPMTWERPAGILRLALLELGRRHSAGDPELALDLHPVEVLGASSLDSLPSRSELERRRADRTAQLALVPPRLLGPDEPQPPLDVLPPNLARTTAMVTMALAELGMDGVQRTEGLRGYGVGTRSYRGTARRAVTPEAAIDALEPGDVLVVPMTSPAYNVVLTLAGALVTSEGGPMSHAAVLSRELGLPAVIGAPAAMTEIPDGADVEVDPLAGTVTVVAAR